MPTRYLKPGIRDSARLEALSLSPDAELLFYRLLVSVDDFGRIDARPLVIKANCFPIRLRATADKCMQWLKDLESVGLILLYEIDNKPFLQMAKWDNKPRAAESKYPPIPDDYIQLHTDAPLTVTVTVTETGCKQPDKHDLGRAQTFKAFWAKYPRKENKQKAQAEWMKITDELETIMAGLSRACISDDWQKEGGKYVPHPSTWLHNKRWQDEQPTAAELGYDPAVLSRLRAKVGPDVRPVDGGNFYDPGLQVRYSPTGERLLVI